MNICIVCQYQIADKRRQSFCSDACLTVFARGVARELDTADCRNPQTEE